MLKIHSFLHRIKKPIEKFLPPNIGKYKLQAGVIAYMMATILFILSPEYIYGGDNNPENYAKAEIVLSKPVDVVEETANEAGIRTSKNEHENLKLMAAGDVTYNIVQMINKKNTTADFLQLGAVAKVDNSSIGDKEELSTQEISEETAGKTETEQITEETKEQKSEEKDKKETKEKKKKKKNTKKRKIELSKSDITILQRIVEAEATGENIKGKILVANVIMNRVKDDSFPDTIEGVVFQKDGSTYQFSPIKDKRYWSVKISDDTITAVKRVMEGEDYSQGALYFSARSKADKSSMSWFDRNLEFLFEYGGHEFFK